MRRRKQWVVTYRFETRQGTWLTEFYRGDRAECVRIYAHSCGGENDRHRAWGWRTIIGPADSWEDFISSTDAEFVEVGPWS